MSFGINEASQNPEYDIVHTVVVYWDGPREGVAGFRGKPHYYNCLFDEQNDNWSNVFVLRPIDAETFSLALEDWNIWLRWRDANQQGLVSLATHPALPEDSERQKQLAAILDKRFKAAQENEVRLSTGEFEAVHDEDYKMEALSRAHWRVRWLSLD